MYALQVSKAQNLACGSWEIGYEAKKTRNKGQRSYFQICSKSFWLILLKLSHVGLEYLHHVPKEHIWWSNLHPATGKSYFLPRPLHFEERFIFRNVAGNGLGWRAIECKTSRREARAFPIISAHTSHVSRSSSSRFRIFHDSSSCDPSLLRS